MACTLQVKLEPTKRKLSYDLKQCVICQNTSHEKLRSGNSQGHETFLNALQERQRVDPCDQYDGLQNYLNIDSNGSLSLKKDTFQWHKSCYSTFTSRTNLSTTSHLSEQQLSLTGDVCGPKKKIPRQSFNFDECCMFCCKKSHNKDKKLVSVSTFGFIDTLQKRIDEKDDEEMRIRVGDFSKLIALGARYHKVCHSKYIVQSKPQLYDASDIMYEDAFTELINNIKPELHHGKALDMNDLLSRYQTLLQRDISEEKALQYTKHKLKAKIQKYCYDTITVHTGSHKTPDFVVSSSLSLKDVINTVSEMKQNLTTAQIEAGIACTSSDDTLISPRAMLYHSALLLRNSLKSKQDIPLDPVNPADISIEKADDIVSDEMYSFLKCMLTSNPQHSLDFVDRKHIAATDPMLHQHILSLGQDLIYTATRGRCRTPKHIGLGLTLHQMTQSEGVIRIINRYGHCISYDEVQRIDTCWAETQRTDQHFVPTNMTPGIVTRAAGDNFNRATESIMGIHHDVVNMVLYQAATDNGTFGNLPKIDQNRKRTLQDHYRPTILQCPNVGGRQPGPTHLFRRVDMDWFWGCSVEHQNMKDKDKNYMLLRHLPVKLFDVDIQREVSPQAIPSWTVYHALVSSKIDISCTAIGFCPMIPAPSTDTNTIYTMMKQLQHMFQTLGQEWTYVVYDEAIYCKAQQIKWRNPEEFRNDIVEMGGMHRVLNFMGDIGSIVEESGIEDILVEANVYGSSVVTHALKGKAYNRGVRIHKLMHEAMNRLKWIAFADAPESRCLQHHEQQAVLDQANKCYEMFQEKPESIDSNELRHEMQVFQESARRLQERMEGYVARGKACSETFLFWENYLSDFSQLLLNFIAAKRDDERKLELETFAEMLPLDFMCGHVNYARWGTVNVIEQRILEHDRPEVYQELCTGQNAVYRSTKPFSGVWHDMGIEQSINKECGKYKHLSTSEGALNKFYLTSHLKAMVATKTKEMCGLQTSTNKQHKEFTKSRTAKDEDAVSRIVDVVLTRMTNPFVIENGADAENKQPLINIATSMVAPSDVTQCLCHIREHGNKELSKFVSDRLGNADIEFFEPLSKPKLSKFSSKNKPLVSSKKKDVKALNIDRQIFSKLSVISQSRDVDIQQLLQYELAPVLLALFNLDGSFRKTAKNEILSWIEQQFSLDSLPESTEPTLAVVDLMMLLQMVCTDTSVCRTFGELSDQLLAIILGMQCQYTAVVGDNYMNKESIKSGERARRGSIQMQDIRNIARNTVLPKQRRKMLSNPDNKANIAHFLLTDWIAQCTEKLSGGKIVELAGGFHDPSKAVIVQQGHHAEIEELASDQEEADSRMFLHIAYAVQNHGIRRLVLWSVDSDVAAMCPRYTILLDIDEFFFRTGTGRKKRFIPMHRVALDMGRDMSLLLPGIHALSGCDSTSSFCGIGKKRWLKTIKEHPELQDGLRLLGSNLENVAENVTKACTSLVALLYQGKETASLDKIRYDLFAKKNLKSDKLPPTSDAFHQHLLRANFQTYIWNHATDAYINASPDGNGWTTDATGRLCPVMMSLPSAPDAVLSFAKCNCQGGCSTRRCKCHKQDMVCTDACACDSESCRNRHIDEPDSDSDTD